MYKNEVSGFGCQVSGFLSDTGHPTPDTFPMNRDNHYEAAFEAYLRARRLPYIAVDEARRSLVADGSIKSLDFIVSPPGQLSWLVDVKGRRFPLLLRTTLIQDNSIPNGFM